MNMEASIRILVVDDDPDISSATSRMLEKASYVTEVAMTRGSALESAHARRPDLILLDRQLPDLDGIEICRKIKQVSTFQDGFVILVSAVNVPSGTRVKGLAAGADGYIARPVRNQELLARVEAFGRILRLYRLLREQTQVPPKPTPSCGTLTGAGSAANYTWWN